MRLWKAREKWRLALVALAAAVLLFHVPALAGCGKKEAASGKPPGEGPAAESAEEKEGVSSDEPALQEDGESVTYDTGEGQVTYQVSREAPPEEALGVPVYPGAAYVPGSGGSVSGKSPEGEFATVGGEFRTAEAFETVYRWYRERLGDPVMHDDRQPLATWRRTAGDRMVIVGLRREGEETIILIYSLQGDTELFTP